MSATSGEMHTDPGDQRRIDVAIGEILDQFSFGGASPMERRTRCFGRIKDLVIEERMRAFDDGKTAVAVASGDPDQQALNHISGNHHDHDRDPFDYPRTVDDTRMRGLEERIDLLHARVQELEKPEWRA